MFGNVVDFFLERREFIIAMIVDLISELNLAKRGNVKIPSLFFYKNII